jgi:predicted nucleic acid-binding protein
MANNRPRLYFDSCCFIDLVKQHIGAALVPEHARNVWYVQKLLEAQRDGALEAYTSVLAVGECVSVEKGQADVPVDVQDRFRRLLTSGQYVRLLNPTPHTQTLIQKFRWDHKLILGAADAIHFAAAIEHGCTEFLTGDGRLKKPKVVAAVPILRSLGMSVIEPKDTAHLPDNYRQMGGLLEPQ